MSPTIVIIIIAAVVVPSAGIAIWLMMKRAARAREAQQWKDAWDDLRKRPEDSLETFNEFISLLKAKPHRAGNGINLTGAYLGRTLCQIRLGEFEEAAESEEKARDQQDWSDDDDLSVSEAWIDALPKHPPKAAVRAYARYLALPERDRRPAYSEKARQGLRAVVAIEEGDSNEQLERVISLTKSILKLLPDHDEALFSQGIALSRLGRWEEALEPLTAAGAAQPRDPKRRHAIAVAYHKTGNLPAARAEYIFTYRLAPTSTSARDAGLLCEQTWEVPFQEPEQAVAAGDTPLSLGAKLLDETTKANPSDGESWAALGRTTARLDRPEEAIPALERASSLGIQSVENLLLLAQMYLKRGQTDQARKALDAVLQLDPVHYDAALLAGDLAYQRKAYSQALGYYRRLGQPRDTDTAERVALTCFEVGENEAVVKLLGHRSPLSMDGRLALGRAQARLGDWPEALVVLQAGDLPVATPTYRYYLANALASNGRYPQAERIFHSLEADPEHGEKARYYLGHVKLMNGDLPGAEECYRASNVSSLAIDLGRLHLVKQEPGAARKHFEETLVAVPTSREAKLGLALSQAELGNTALLTDLNKDPELERWAAEPLADLAYEDRNYVGALEAYQRTIKGRKRIASRIMARMSIGYLHLNKHADAYPQLVELARRHPDVPGVRWNLALCRYHIGREHFRLERWDQARGEFSRCRHLLQPVAPKEAEGIRRWEAEASYRTATAMILTDPPTDLERASQLFEEGTKAFPGEFRWWLGSALVAALEKKHDQAATRFEKAAELAPDRLEFAIGRGMSLHATDNNTNAESALAPILTKIAPTMKPAIRTAARVTLANIYAAEKKWQLAADTLAPLLDDPFVRSSKRYGPVDVAQSMVAYYALAGDRNKAAEVARVHLPGQGTGDLMLALVQAESGDYAGAADALEKVYEQDQRGTIRKLLVSCLLNAAADCVRNKDMKGASAFVRRALNFDANNKDAIRFDSALDFGKQLANLNPKKLNEAIQECEAMVKRPGSAAQLVRTLGVLYHRRALQAEKSGKDCREEWNKCCIYWRERIFQDDTFWANFMTDYNAGKSRKELVKQEDLDKWRSEIALAFAKAQSGIFASSVKSGDKKALARHIELIWEWAPNFEPPKDFLAGDLGNIDEDTANLLDGALKKINNLEGQKSLVRLLSTHWNVKASAPALRGIEINRQACANYDSAITNGAAQLAGANQYQKMLILLQTKGAVESVERRMREAQGLIYESQGLFKKAKSALSGWRKQLHKTHGKGSRDPVYTATDTFCNEQEARMDENIKAVNDMNDTVNKNLAEVRDFLRKIS